MSAVNYRHWRTITRSIASVISPKLLRVVITLILAAVLAAALLRTAPGWSVDEQETDPRFSRKTIEIVRQERQQRRSSAAFFVGYFGGLLRGDLGRSELYDRPVSELILQRAGSTAVTVGAGFALGWVAAIVAASAAAVVNSIAVTLGSMCFNVLLLSTPSAVLAILCLVVDLPPAAAIACVVFPRVFPHAAAQFESIRRAPHVVMARARGLSAIRTFVWHIAPVALPPVMAISGATVPLAFGAAIPIEALADSPGIGQLTWRAALGRDMPVLVSVTLVMTVLTVAANALSDLALSGRSASS